MSIRPGLVSDIFPIFVHSITLFFKIPCRKRKQSLNSIFLAGTYASSKAAVNAISETLRLELSPFGVSVVTIMLGTVATPFHANEPAPELPATSYYSAILDTITKWAKGQAGPKGGPVQDVVDAMIPDIVAEGRNGVVWRGANSTAVWFGSRWLPGRMLVSWTLGFPL